MDKLKFNRIGDTDFFNLYIDKKLAKEKITLEEVLFYIAEKEKENEND